MLNARIGAALPRKRRRPTLRAYIEFRLGVGTRSQLRNLLVRPLGASSFSEFWRYWNPVYGYVIGYYLYRPLRKLLPRPLAMWLSFVGCGFLLHDLVGWGISGRIRFPEMTLLFAVFGACAVASDLLRVDLGRQSFVARAASNAGLIAASGYTVHTLAGAMG